MKLTKLLKTFGFTAALCLSSTLFVSCESEDEVTDGEVEIILPDEVFAGNIFGFIDGNLRLNIVEIIDESQANFRITTADISETFNYTYQENDDGSHTLRLFPLFLPSFTESVLESELDDASSDLFESVNDFSEVVTENELSNFIEAAIAIGSDINTIDYDESLNLYMETSFSFIISSDDVSVTAESSGDGFTVSTESGVDFDGVTRTNTFEDEFTFSGFLLSN